MTLYLCRVKIHFIFLVTLFFWAASSQAQTENNIQFLRPSPTFNQNRFNLAFGTTTVYYTGFSYALYQTWYKGYEQEKFHFFNDSREWEQIDKFGHGFSSYFQTNYAYQASKWTGMSENKAILSGVLLSTLIQTTIEVFDGFSSKWGFSTSDYLVNIMGTSSFAIQQVLWHEQRILMKISSTRQSYSRSPIRAINTNNTSNLQHRADGLFGTSSGARFLKDYNAQTIWISTNLASFSAESKMPQWLNIAFGYGANNMFGGFQNVWSENESQYDVSAAYPRHRQFYFSLDLDLTKIKTKSPFIKTLLFVLNIIKIPSPTLEYNTLGETKFHWLFF